MLIDTCGKFGVTARREDGRTGAWAKGGKIGAIGIRVARWVTMHGTALNVATDLARFSAIIPCGLSGAGVTSIERETGHRFEVEEVAAVQARAFADVLGMAFDDGIVGLPE